jgi:hypothetical protein
MAAYTFTKLLATPCKLVYLVSGTATATLAYSVYEADCVAGPLKAMLDSNLVAAVCNTNAKARSAVITGEGIAANQATPTFIQTRLQTMVGVTANGPIGVDAVDSGAGDNPDIVLTAADAGATTAYLEITIAHSIIR